MNNNYSSDEGILFNKNKSVLISVPSKLRPNTHEDDTLGEETAIIRTEEVKSPEDGAVVFQDLVEGITYVNKTDRETGKTYKETIHTNGTTNDVGASYKRKASSASRAFRACGRRVIFRILW